METFKFKDGGGEQFMNPEDRKGHCEVVVFHYQTRLSIGGMIRRTSDYSVYWGVDVDSAKARFLESGSVKEDGVTEASVWVGWLKDELHIETNPTDPHYGNTPTWARHLVGEEPVYLK